jgi:hypothetical protein
MWTISLRRYCGEIERNRGRRFTVARGREKRRHSDVARSMTGKTGYKRDRCVWDILSLATKRSRQPYAEVSLRVGGGDRNIDIPRLRHSRYQNLINTPSTIGGSIQLLGQRRKKPSNAVNHGKPLFLFLYCIANPSPQDFLDIVCGRRNCARINNKLRSSH